MYSSVNDKNQTIGTSGCGPTSAAMVVTAIKGTITPSQMADLFVKHGYRSANNGTYLSAFRFVADTFDIEYQEKYKLDEALELLRNNHYVIVSVANGLFTTEGHLMVITELEGDMLKIYDPYLYSGKFDTSTRRGKVEVRGNTVYCSIENFRNYANYTRFFAYKHNGDVQENNSNNVTTEAYTRYVKVNTVLNVRNGAGTNYNIVEKLKNGTEVKVYENNGKWSRIDSNKWVCSDYLTEDRNVTMIEIKGYKTGNYKVTASVLNVRNGPGAKYKAKMYKQLSDNARAQNKKLGNYYTNGYKKGVVCTITKTNGNWGLTKSGWVCLDYCKKI